MNCSKETCIRLCGGGQFIHRGYLSFFYGSTAIGHSWSAGKSWFDSQKRIQAGCRILLCTLENFDCLFVKARGFQSPKPKKVRRPISMTNPVRPSASKSSWCGADFKETRSA